MIFVVFRWCYYILLFYHNYMLLRKIFAPPDITYTVSTPTGVGDLCQKIHIVLITLQVLIYIYSFKFNIVCSGIRFTLQHRGCDWYFTFNLWYLINYNIIYNVYNSFSLIYYSKYISQIVVVHRAWCGRRQWWSLICDY